MTRPSAQETPRSSTLTILMWAASLTLVMALSMWPYDFDPTAGNPKAWRAFWQSWGWRSHRGDIAANFVLFVPVGVLAVVSVAASRAGKRIAVTLAFSLAVAIAAQIAQIYLPSRAATFVDVTWNAVGLLVGSALGLVVRTRRLYAFGLLRTLWLLPAGIVGLWLTYRLAPFVPSIDLQLVKDNLKPILLQPRVTVAGVFVSAAAWTTVAMLLRDAWVHRQGDLWLVPFVASTFVAEAFIIASDGINADNVIGASVAAVLWFTALRWLPRPSPIVWGVLAVAVVVDGLWPFQFATRPVYEFQWFPFRGILGGSMLYNLTAILGKLFFYTALAYTGWRAVNSWTMSAVVGAILLGCVEWFQRYQSGHVPEITDPIILVTAALICARFAEWNRPELSPSQSTQASDSES